MNQNLKDTLKVGDVVEFVLNGWVTGSIVPDIFLVEEIGDLTFHCKFFVRNSDYAKNANPLIRFGCPFNMQDRVRILKDKELLNAILKAT